MKALTLTPLSPSTSHLPSMATPREAFQHFVSVTPYAHRDDELYCMFDREFHMDVTVQQHHSIFVEALDFMEGYIIQFFVQNGLDSTHWVPCDLLFDCRRCDPSFKHRLDQICKVLLEKHFLKFLAHEAQEL